MIHDDASPDLPMAVVHGALLTVAAATGLYDMAVADASGLYIGSILTLPLVVAIIGFARHRRGRRDGRWMMAAADTGLLLIVVLYLQLDRTFGPGIAVLFIALFVVLALAGLATILIAATPPSSKPMVRSPLHGRGLIAYVVIGLVAGIPMFSSGFRPPLAILLFMAMPVVVSIVLISITWWWGVRWPMVLASIGRFVTVPLLAAFGGSWLAIAAGIGLGVLGLVLAARPPRTMGESTPAAAERTREPTAAAVTWALTGTMLLVPSLLIGPLAPRLVDCFDCPPPSPLAGPSIIVDLIALILLPVLALSLAVTRRRASSLAHPLAWAGLVVSVLVLGQALLSMGRAPGFEFSLSVGPAAAIASLGFGTAVGRPAFLIGVGPVAAVLAALAGTAWTTGASMPGFAPPDFAVIQAGTLGTGMAVTLALGREFAIRAVAPAHPPLIPDDEQLDEVAEAVETSTVTASIHRR
jgi:hypothetical protein